MPQVIFFDGSKEDFISLLLEAERLRKDELKPRQTVDTKTACRIAHCHSDRIRRRLKPAIKGSGSASDLWWMDEVEGLNKKHLKVA
ncbi:MAG: hypothetical protein M3P98_01015 [bacterium]|nr:hypothetical protein [bacterium]